MGIRRNSKRDKLLSEGRKLAADLGRSYIDPALLFDRASPEDLENYSAEMLVHAACLAADEINSWRAITPKVSLHSPRDVKPGGQACSILSVTARNMPFLFDSVMGEVVAQQRNILLAVHPILLVAKDKPVRISTHKDKDDPAERVSYIQIHLPALNDIAAEGLLAGVNNVLSKVVQSVNDWPLMLQTLDDAISGLKAQQAIEKRQDHEESLAFLKWLRDDNFTFLGMREYNFSGGKDGKVERARGDGLGILSDPDVRVLRFGKDAVTTTPEIIAFLEGPNDLIVTKANVKSVVHRRAYMDYVGIKLYNKNGSVSGELRVVGLFTSTAYTRPAAQIPLLRSKISRIVQRFGLDVASHSGKTLINSLESYPRDDLFQIDTNLLAGFAEQIMELVERPRVRVLPRIDHFDRFVSLIVYVPRDQYDSRVREKIGEYFTQAYQGRLSAYYPAFPEGGVARVHFIIGRSEGKTPNIPQAELEHAVREIATNWDDRFAALAEGHNISLSASRAYQTAFDPNEAYGDLDDLDKAATSGISLKFHALEDRPGTLGLKIFHAEIPLSLSRRVPLLENLGFRVISERTFELTLRSEDGDQPVILHDMQLDVQTDSALELARDGQRLDDAFLAAFTGIVDDDSFNRLVLSAKLTFREVSVLRAYARYMRQAGVTYSQGYIADTLARHPDIAVHLLKLFEARFDPSMTGKTREQAQRTICENIENDLASVPSLDEDRILRRYINVIKATLRVNYYQIDDEGGPRQTLAFKLDPRSVEGLPEPHPYREIFVYGGEVEGIHLRYGKVARGGLRWSDRAQDYRTEVLGLVKAQQVKNSVIVPVGAKGGFYPKKLPVGGSRDEVFEAGKSAYKTFIRTLLSVTDNIDGNEIIPPENTIRHDEDDPYFVVAADKGTATFSDTANELAQEAGFWLDDAFASGGSAGYDHKKMGITARGAWETVKRHFREMDIDIQSTPFTVAGVGDMSGDVFGNGMLLSRKIRLIAAFDHRDIMIDPDPDIAISYAERQRLFALPRSSWQDYGKDKLSKGGMIISRAEKSVRLTPEAAAAIGLGKTSATPFEVINAILRAEVDLFWFGGIGTYIRSSAETNAEVGDRANDPVRISAAEVRAKVIGEGANLGVTQRGRIAFGLKGGRCNSDAIDNSAGVNSSDVEVNIKIALANAMREGRLTRSARNKLLASMTDDVAELVLRNNYLQSLAITLCQRKGLRNAAELTQLMNRLEADGHLDRANENLPDTQTMQERYASGHPLTRAEIGVLLSYSKIVLFDELVASELPDDPWFEPLLTSYFPTRMRKTYHGDIESHRLRREIIATQLANHAINRGGPAFLSSMRDSTGASSSEIVKAAIIVSDGFDLTKIWGEIDALDNAISGDLQNSLYEMVAQLYETSSRLVIKTGLAKLPLEQAVDRLRKACANAMKQLSAILPQHQVAAISNKAETLTNAGIPQRLADELAAIQALDVIPEIVTIADAANEKLERAGHIFFGVSETFRVSRLLAAAESLQPSDQFEAQALAHSLDEISDSRRAISMSVLVEGKGEKNPLLAWHEKHNKSLGELASRLTNLTDTAEPTLARCVVAAGWLNTLAKDTGA